MITEMSRPFSRIADGQDSGSGSHILGTGSGARSVTGNGLGNGVGTGVGAGVRSWWRNSREESRRESMASNESVPKPPSQGSEMVTVSSNFAGLSPVITSGLYNPPNITSGLYNTSPAASPVLPRTGSDSVMFAPPPQQSLQDLQPLERPQAAAVRNETIGAADPGMLGVGQVVQRPVDVEAQQPPPRETGKRWWEGGSLKGLQSKLITVLVAGFFLAITLAIYLGLALSDDLRLRHGWHILLILIILIATMFFCHALVQLCILATNPSQLQRRSSRNFSRIPSVSGPDGYANPREPIRIQTHFEHDADGVEPDLTKLPPPVYGLWRCSVRVNPNQFYWVRRTSVQPSTIPEGTEPTSPRSRNIPRPPSYVSEDGVSYALAAGNTLPPPRPEPPLPPHPSEVRRL